MGSADNLLALFGRCLLPRRMTEDRFQVLDHQAEQDERVRSALDRSPHQRGSLNITDPFRTLVFGFTVYFV